MSDQLFREKSLKKVNSPEDLNDYVKVANPGVWLLLGALIILLIGTLVWSIYGKLDTVVQALGVVENKQVNIYIKESDMEKIDENTIFKLDNNEIQITSKSKEPIVVDKEFSEYMLHVGELSVNEWVYVIKAQTDVSDGVYPIEVIIESIKPISFVIN